jgi:cobalamin biosynthesis Mg chelatase CobN
MADEAMNLQHHPRRPQLVINNVQTNVTDAMADAPTRDEITARLEAAEARTETRITQLGAGMEARATATDHKVDTLIGKIDALATAVTGVVAEVRADNKETRRAVWIVGIGAVLSVFGLVVALWIAGINVQANMIGAFQAAIGVRSLNDNATPKGPSAASPPSSTPPASPAGR